MLGYSLEPPDLLTCHRTALNFVLITRECTEKQGCAQNQWAGDPRVAPNARMCCNSLKTAVGDTVQQGNHVWNSPVVASQSDFHLVSSWISCCTNRRDKYPTNWTGRQVFLVA
eukprot:TRINITY_DN67315_c4_g1_i1.p1 TRINITY_DN67315_c4_g1~~TRINITY_DN67315_c4_g1_i1.p1  ORF type:complete len:113 (+),score=2.99 TRINITY_DN67315_c4_g1_i1:28-366(+)